MITSLHLGDEEAAWSCPRPHPSATFDFAAGLQPIISYVDVRVQLLCLSDPSLQFYESCVYFSEANRKAVIFALNVSYTLVSMLYCDRLKVKKVSSYFILHPCKIERCKIDMVDCLVLTKYLEYRGHQVYTQQLF